MEFDVGNPNTIKYPVFGLPTIVASIFVFWGGLVPINTMDALEQNNGLWSPSFVAASCLSEKTFKKKII